MIHEPRRESLRRVARPLGVLALGLVLAVALPAPGFLRGLAGYATLHLVLELASIVVSAMLAVIAWSALRHHGRPDAGWLAAAFVAVALLDLGHALAFPGMPPLVTEAGTEKAIDFWLVARSCAALGLLGIVLPGLSRPVPARWLLGGALALVALVYAVVLWRPGALPRTFVPGQGLTALKIGWEVLLVLAYATVALLLLLGARRARPYDVPALFVGACALAFSEVFFTLYADVTDHYNLLGHVYKVIGYAYLYRAIFAQAVVQPYRELAAAQARLQATLETIPDLLWLKDRDGVYLDCNPRFERLYGASRAQIVGRTDADFVSAELAAFFRHHDRLAMETGRPSVNEEWLTFAADGYRGLFETIKTPMRDADGRLVGVLGIARDITERHQAEARRQALEAQLREAQKMESLGTLAGGIAHDFNNVLGAILGHLALAEAELPPDHPARASLAQIGRSGLRARDLVQQILAFSRRQPQRMLEQPLRPLVEEAAALLKATLPARVRLLTTFAEPTPAVRADATQVQQVLMNLCTNAWHALGDAPGEIEIGYAAVTLAADEARGLGLASAGPHAHLWVRDTGSGMDEATRARIFEPFFTTKSPGQGTGLGLAVVHGIVSAHGGAIRVDSAPGRGSTFHLYLPALEGAAAPPAPAPAAPPAAAPAQAGRGRRVLVVDDDAVMATLVERLLERQGWRVDTCDGAAAALERFRADPSAPDAVVTDYNMPDGSGLELAAALTALRPGLPVIVSSGHVSEELLAGIEAAGVRRVLHKERTLEDLPRLLAEVLP